MALTAPSCRTIEQVIRLKAELQSWLAEDPIIRAALQRMVMRMEGNPDTQEDLFQEAWVHLWSRQQQYPGRPPGWYLQGVRFHLNDLRNSGRSLDSPKRCGGRAFPDDRERQDEWLDTLDCDNGFLSAVTARDIFSLLVDRLSPRDRRILDKLAEGHGVRDIAGQLKISHQSVIRGRERIAALAIELGVVPPPA